MKAVVIGAGPAGLGAGYNLKQKGYEVIVIDKRESIGGLCGSFKINNFTFDRFIHVSFAKNPQTLDIYNQSCSIRKFEPKMYNRYKNKWIGHPAQYNLGKLPFFQRIKIIASYLFRNKYEITNYKTYLYRNYGKCFSDSFNIPYTRMYWQENPENMEVKWLNGRMYDLSLTKLIKGALTSKDNIQFYANAFDYPDTGDGFASFYNFFLDKLDFKLSTEVTNINTKDKKVTLSNGEIIKYDVLVNTSPIKEISNILNITNSSVLDAIKNLNHTSGYVVSLGLNKDPSYKDSMYFYNYNEDVLSARAYFPHKKTEKNCPKGSYSMQIEIYTKNAQLLDETSEQFEHTIDEFLRYCNLDRSYVLFKDIRFEKYANILFDPDIYTNREIVLKYLKEQNIYSIGRFGSWDYLWSFQSLEAGLNLKIDE